MERVADMPDWLELELAQGLAPTPAPEELWARVRHPRPASARRTWPVAAAAYTVGEEHALLLVTRTGGAESPHGRATWKSGGQLYALASSNLQHLEGACVLCHTSL